MNTEALLLDSDWRLRSSEHVGDGARLSLPGFDTRDFYPARLPATVLGTLVEAGVFPDPFVGDQFRRLPGLGPPHENFSNHPFPEHSPFAVPWWFQREFELTARAPGEQVWLHFDGINYRASLWLNGALVAGPATVAGAYRTYDFCVTEQVRTGANGLALEVLPPQANDLAITWVDWNPSPPDKNMGLWRSAWLRRTGELALSQPHVVTTLGAHGAELTLHADVENPTDHVVRGRIEFSLFGERLCRDIEVAPKNRLHVVLRPDDHAALRIREPRLWWPRRMGEPALHDLGCNVLVDGTLSDRAELRFGIREITSELQGGHALFRVNGRPLLVRGGGWAGDLFQRENVERERQQYEYVKDLGLNAIRFEGMLPSERFLRWCDEDGVLVIAGLCCCDHWEKWDNWKPEDYEVAAESLRTQVRRLRAHPCVMSFWYGSDFPPPRHVEERYLSVFDDEHWQNPTHSSAAAKPTELTGPSGLKMAGPYDYVPPSYWLSDEERGGAFGFATEISPGPAIPPVESLRSMLGDEHLWPQDNVWTLHAGGGPFKSLELFDTALSKRYGSPRDVRDYALKAQLACYEGQRAMFEAFSQRKYRATGVVQWMLNNAWPSLIWHLWDWYLRPGGGYFGTKKACEPLHVQYSAEERKVFVVSELWEAFEGVLVSATIVDANAHPLWRGEATLDVPADGAVPALALPSPAELGAPPLYFVKLALEYAGRLVSSNFYWVSSQADLLAHDKGTWYFTPQSEFADFTALAELPRATLAARALSARRDREIRCEFELENTSSSLAFFTRLRLLVGERELLPVRWSDNFVSLLPGEKLTIEAALPLELCPEAWPSLEHSGWNSARTVVDVQL